MVRLRFLQALLLTVAITGGVKAWRALAIPPPDKLREIAEAPLNRIFGKEATFDWPFQIDFNDGIQIRNLRVPSIGGTRVVSTEAGGIPKVLHGLEADRVSILHDRVALAAGRHKPVRIELQGARLITHETEEGIALDFPLDMSGQGHPDDKLPEIIVKDVELYFRAMEGSKRLRSGSVLRVVVDELTLLPGLEGTTIVKGAARALGLGQDDTPITVDGWIAKGGQEFELKAEWDPLELTPELLGALADDIAVYLRQRSVQSGRFTLNLSRSETQREGAIEPRLEWDSAVEINIQDLPGLDSIDEATKVQLQQLFGRGAFQVAVGKDDTGTEDRVDITSLVSELAGGRVRASGYIMSETGAFRINFEIQGLRLEDPAVRTALGPDGAELFEEFDPKGIVDAFGHVSRAADGEVEWSVNVLLEDASLTYIGSVGEDGKREGFPYTISDVTGQVKIRPGIVEFDDIVGFNRGAEVTILGFEGNEAWTGGETGRVRLTDDGADVRLTVIATDVPMDAELIEAIEGSEFSEMLDEFKLVGTVDKIELDLIKIPAIERTVKTEMRLTLLGEQFVYIPFPLPLEDVSGTVIMRRPVIGAERGRVYAFDVTGWAEGAPVHISAESREHEARGRMQVKAEGLPLAGSVTEAVVSAPATAEDLGDTWRWLAPSGRADVVVDLPLGDDPDPMHLEAHLKGASIHLNALGEAPLEIADLSGRLEVRDGGVYLHGLTGAIGGAPVDLRGSMLGGVDGRWDLRAHIDNLRLTPSLGRSLSALTEGGSLLPGEMRFEAGSRMTFDLHLTREPGEDTDLQIDFIASDLDTVVRLSDGSLLSFSGEHLEVKGDLLRARKLKAESEGLRIAVPEAEINLGAETAEFFGRFELAMDGFALEENLLDVLPESVREGLADLTKDRLLRSKSLEIDAPRNAPVTLRGDLMFEVPEGVPVGEGPRGAVEFAPLVIDGRGAQTTFRGHVALHGFSMDIGLELEDLDGRIDIEDLRLGDDPSGVGRIEDLGGRIEGITVSGIRAPLVWSQDVLRIRSVTGRLADGAVDGSVVLHTAEPISYEGRLAVRDFDVAKLWADLAPTGPEVSGVGQLQLTFQNRGGAFRDLTAAGSLYIRKGRLADLPVVASIFTLFDEVVQAEERAQIERANVRFTLQREIIRFSQLDLAGPLFDMPGKGTLDLAGTVDLRFTPDFIKGMLLPGVMQLPLVGDVLHGVLREELLYAVRIRGDLSDPETELEALPPLGLDKGRSFAGTGSPKLPKRRLPRWFR